MVTRKTALSFAGMLLGAAVFCTQAAPSGASKQKSIKHGEYLAVIGGCHDCHTPGWNEHDGHAPRDKLLTGEGTVFQGPWGTTYPVNLRLLASELTLQQWIQQARATRARPAMPWWVLQRMSEVDLTALYDYIHALGPAGKPAHAFVPPGQPASPPYFKMVMPGPSSGR